MDLIRVSRRRRKRELIRVSIIVFIVNFFLAAFLLYQSQMEEYENQRNIRLCGSWILEQSGYVTTPEALHPYVKKTGEVLGGVHVYLTDDGDAFSNDTGVYIGTLPDNMSDIGRVRIFDGRMPEGEGEIALTLGALERLGLSYELGQRIEVCYGKYYDYGELREKNMNQEYHTKQYVVTGILYNYLDLWSTGSGMPGMIVSAEDFAALDAQKIHFGFYSLKDDYADVNPEFARTLAEGDAAMSYNAKVYDAVLWDSEVTNVWVLISVMVIGCCAMVYIIIQENRRRKSAYYLMRCIGASKGQIRAFSIQESVFTMLPAAAAGVLGAYLICAAAVIFVSRAADIEYFFAFDVALLLRIVGVVFLTMLVAVLASQTTLMSRCMVQGEGKISARRANRLRKKIHGGKNGRMITPAYAAKRQNALHPVRTILLRVIGIAVCSVVLYSFTKIYTDISYYKGFKSSVNDFTIDMPSGFYYQIDYEDKETGMVTSTNASFYDTDGGFSKTALKSMELVEEIRALNYNARVSTHKLTWNGMEQSEHYREAVDEATKVYGINGGYWQYDDKYGELFTEIYCSNYYDIWEAFAKNIRWDGADRKRFESGEQVLVLFNTEETDSSLTAGTVIHIPTASGNIDVEAAAVGTPANVSDGVPYGGKYYTIYGSEALGERIAAADGKEFKYTQAEFIFDNYRDAEFIAQQLSIIAVRNGGSYTSRYGELKNQYKSIMHEFFMYGCFVAALFFMFAVIRIAILKDDIAGLREARAKYKQEGVDDGFLIKQSACDAAKDGLSLLASIPVFVAIYGFVYANQIKKTAITGGWLISHRLGRIFTYSTAKEGLKLVSIQLLDLPYEWNLVIVAVIVIVFVIVGTVMTVRELRAGRL